MSWTLDKVHSNVSFSVRHMMVSKVKGRFGEFDATIDIDEAEPARSSLEARVQVASIDTREVPRDAHLRSADFFDADNHPEMVFRSTRVESGSNGKLRLVGDLTIRGTTREIVLDGEYEGPLADIQGQRRFGFELQGRVDREAFGLLWNMPIEAGGFLVGKDVELSIDGEVVEGQ
ncbi:MAG: YceI family protein [Dehalococcoidia bacterium]|nr:YceI family protein [Dehalococcoidia bacterium]MCA9849753.1 YceI family protein [Dehalococcoidia bacterium]MCA9855677.1 YceI family protein [Dehalococcoidia bacterium]